MSAALFFRPQHRIEASVLMVAGGFLVVSQIHESDWIALGLGLVSFGLGVASLVRQLRPYAFIADGTLHVREGFFGAARTLALRETDRWEAYQYPDAIRFFRQGARIAEFSLSPLSHSERSRLLHCLAVAVPGEQFGS